MQRRFSITEKKYELSAMGRAALFGLIRELISEDEFKTFVKGEEAVRPLFENPKPGMGVTFDAVYTGMYFEYALKLVDRQTSQVVLSFGFTTSRADAEERSVLPKFSTTHLKTYDNVFDSLVNRYGQAFNSDVVKAYELMFSKTAASAQSHYAYNNRGLMVCLKNQDTDRHGHLLYLETFLPPTKADDVR